MTLQNVLCILIKKNPSSEIKDISNDIIRIIKGNLSYYEKNLKKDLLIFFNEC